MNFKSGRAENVIELMVSRNSAARYVFRDLLEEMQDLGDLVSVSLALHGQRIRFLALIQQLMRPDRYGELSRFDATLRRAKACL